MLSSKVNYVLCGVAGTFSIIGALLHVNLLFLLFNIVITAWYWYDAERQRELEDLLLLAEHDENKTSGEPGSDDE